MDTNNPLPLDMDLGSVDTSRPLLSEGIHEFRIDKVEMKQTAVGKKMLSIAHKTLNPATSIKGDSLGAGILVFNNINLEVSGKATQEMVTRNMAELVKGCGGGVTYGDLLAGGQVLAGRTCKAKVAYVPAGVSKMGKSFPEKNEIAYYIPAGQ